MGAYCRGVGCSNDVARILYFKVMVIPNPFFRFILVNHRVHKPCNDIAPFITTLEDFSGAIVHNRLVLKASACGC